MRKEKVATPRAKQVWTPCSRIILLNFAHHPFKLCPGDLSPAFKKFLTHGRRACYKPTHLVKRLRTCLSRFS
jgi:hypothetical protein